MITERSEMDTNYRHATLEEAEFTLGSILEIIQEGTWDYNALTSHVTRSNVWYKMLGYEAGVFAEDVLTWEHIIHPDDYARVMEHFEKYTQGINHYYSIQYRCKKANDSYIWIHDRAQIVARTKDGLVARMIGAHENIDEKKRAQEELVQKNKLLEKGNLSLEKLLETKNQELELKNKELEEKIKEIEDLSTTDSLTKVANRRKFETELRHETARSFRYNNPLSLVICDIDHFKRCNDTYGHKAGDKILVELASLLRRNLRINDFIARWGGEEFVILLPETSSLQAHKIIEKLRILIAKTLFLEELQLSCSFGIAQLRKEDTSDTFFSRADAMLYKAKANGRNKVEATA